jgi:ribosomal protein L18
VNLIKKKKKKKKKKEAYKSEKNQLFTYFKLNHIIVQTIGNITESKP